MFNLAPCLINHLKVICNKQFQINCEIAIYSVDKIRQITLPLPQSAVLHCCSAVKPKELIHCTRVFAFSVTVSLISYFVCLKLWKWGGGSTFGLLETFCCSGISEGIAFLRLFYSLWYIHDICIILPAFYH